VKDFRKCEAEIAPFREERTAELMELISEIMRTAVLKDINLVKYLTYSFVQKSRRRDIAITLHITNNTSFVIVHHENPLDLVGSIRRGGAGHISFVLVAHPTKSHPAVRFCSCY
jgi:hypothetical protein